jgi:hypothetical protein
MVFKNFMGRLKPKDDNKHAIKVELVKTATEKRLGGLAWTLYRNIINKDYIIVSDSEQYKGAKALWKKLLSDNMLDTYFFDTEEKDYITVELKDEDIWAKFPNTNKENIVLVASKR